MASQTTAGSGGRCPPNGSSAPPSPPTGRRTGSASSDRRRRKPAGRRLFAFDGTLGSRLVAGADEAGRGCLAGPLVAAAVVFDRDALSARRLRTLADLDDSKRQTVEARERLLPLIVGSARRVAVVSRCAGTIDSEGLHRTNIAALEDALRRATAGLGEAVACVVDGFSLDGLEIPHRRLVGGDGTSAAIAAASIVAKVTRDRVMRHAETVHPGWSFANHVGYATPEHREAIRSRGVSPLHRLSFASPAYLAQPLPGLAPGGSAAV